jgi:hypothetical protein
MILTDYQAEAERLLKEAAKQYRTFIREAKTAAKEYTRAAAYLNMARTVTRSSFPWDTSGTPAYFEECARSTVRYADSCGRSAQKAYERSLSYRQLARDYSRMAERACGKELQ